MKLSFILFITCKQCGACTIGGGSPNVFVFSDLLNSTAVEALIHPRHTEDEQPVRLSPRIIVQKKLCLGETAAVVPIQLHLLYPHPHNQKLTRCSRGGGWNRRRRHESRRCKRGEEPAKNEDAAAPLPLRHQTGQGQVVSLCY